jgi:hypothetical protein
LAKTSFENSITWFEKRSKRRKALQEHFFKNCRPIGSMQKPLKYLFIEPFPKPLEIVTSNQGGGIEKTRCF